MIFLPMHCRLQKNTVCLVPSLNGFQPVVWKPLKDSNSSFNHAKHLHVQVFHINVVPTCTRISNYNTTWPSVSLSLCSETSTIACILFKRSASACTCTEEEGFVGQSSSLYEECWHWESSNSSTSRLLRWSRCGLRAGKMELHCRHIFMTGRIQCKCRLYLQQMP